MRVLNRLLDLGHDLADSLEAELSADSPHRDREIGVVSNYRKTAELLDELLKGGLNQGSPPGAPSQASPES